MATFDTAKIRGFYHSESAVWYAPDDVAPPVGIEKIPAGHTLVGALTSKGPGESRSSETQQETLWQGATAFNAVSNASIEFDAEFMEHTKEVFSLINGAPIETVGSEAGQYYSQIVRAGDKSPVLRFVIDGYDSGPNDGLIIHRIIFRGTLRRDGESRMEAGKPTIYPVKINVENAEYEIRTNDPEWA